MSTWKGADSIWIYKLSHALTIRHNWVKNPLPMRVGDKKGVSA